jgi:DNA-binding transcriptional MerR regulator
MSYSVGQVARISGVTVRTLHHYDQIGLLTPSGRSAAGYRRYSEEDLQRLHQILTYRELGFPLEEIAELLTEPADVQAHLRRQHELLLGRIERLQKMADAIELMMEAQQMGIQLTPEERFEVFGDADPTRYEEEARQRWGDTEAYRQSQQRAATYTKQDWQRIKDETEALYGRIAAAMRSGEPATGQVAMDLAEEHRQQINRWFYECGHEMHRNLAELYVTDQRFTASLDQNAPGLAVYLREAILANADRAAA